MAGNWIVKSQAGTLTAAPVANAPNVSFASASVTLSLWSHSTQFSFSGTINLPTSAPDYSHLKQIDLIAYGPAGKIVPVATLMSAEFTGSTISFSGGPNPFSSSAPESWALKAWALNEDSVATSTPATASLTVTPPAITGLTGTDSTADRWVDANRSVYAPQSVAITCDAMTFTLWDFDGTRNNWQGWYTVGGNQTFKIGLREGKEIIFAPPSTETHTLKAAPGAWEGNDANGWRCPDLGLGSRAIGSVPGLYASSPYSVAGMQKPFDDEITSLSIPGGAGGTYPYDILTDGLVPQHVAYISSIGYSDTGCNTSSSFVTLTVTDLDASGNPVSAEQKYGVRAVIGQGGQNFGDLIRSYGNNGGDYPRTGIIAKVRFQVYVGSRKNSDDNAWTDTTTYTRQVHVGVGGNMDVTIAVGGATSTSLTKSLVKTPQNELSVNTSNSSNILYNGDFANGDAGWVLLSGGMESVGSFAFSAPTYWRDAMNTSGGVEQDAIGCRPGDQFYAEAYVNAGFGTTSGTVFLSLQFYDYAGSAIPGGSGGNPFSTIALVSGMGWTQVSLSGVTAPAGACSVTIRVQVGTASGTGFWYIDNVFLSRQVSAGDGTQPDGRGGVQVKTGNGTRINPTTRGVELKTGATLDIDGTGGAVVKTGTLGEGYFVGGALGNDLTKWSSSQQPFGWYFGLPSLPNSNIPATIINTAENPWRVYTKLGTSTWITAKTQPGDLVAGAISALVSMTAPTITGGSISAASISGSAITITAGATTVTVSSTAFSGSGLTTGPGVSILDTSASTQTVIGAGAIRIRSTSTSSSLTLLGGSIIIDDGVGHVKVITATSIP